MPDISTSIISAPLAPTGFQTTQQFPISITAENVTFAWDELAPSGITVQYYELNIFPASLSQTSDILASPFVVSLTPYITHTASLTAVNCVGRSPTIALETGKNLHVYIHTYV